MPTQADKGETNPSGGPPLKTGWAIAFGLLGGLLGAGLLGLIFGPPRGKPVALLPPPSPSPIMVHVSGAVLNPGLYSLPENSRVMDALNSAGGLLPEADAGRLNLAAQVRDGMQVSVPFMQGEGGNNSETANLTPESSFPININTATLEELDLLPGIGPVKAQAIIDYREEHGYFGSIEEIQNVPGIGPATFEQIKDMITY